MPIKFDTTTRTPLTEGGEGYIYEYNGKIIKTFKPHIDIAAKERKVNLLMKTSLPKAVITPIDTVLDMRGRFIGYCMEKVSGEKIEWFKNKKYVISHDINTKFVLEILVKIKKLLKEIHRNGMAIGDLNTKNILFDYSGNVYIIDCDSWSVAGENCSVAMETFKDPKVKRDNFTEESDNYSFMVIAWSCLTRVHPFGGVMNPDIDILERMKKELSVIDRIGIKLPRVTKSWKGFSPDLVSEFKSVFEGGVRTISGNMEDMLNNLTQCKRDKEYYYSKFSSCPYCDSNAQVNKKPVSQGSVGGLKLYAIYDGTKIKAVFDRYTYLDNEGYVNHGNQKELYKGARYYFLESRTRIFDHDNCFIFWLFNTEKSYQIYKKYKAQIETVGNSIYYISEKNTFCKMEVMDSGNGIKNICKVSNTAYFAVSDDNYCVVNYYTGKIIVNINGTNTVIDYDSDIVNYGIHHDEVSGKWLIILEDSKGKFNTFVISGGTVEYQTDAIKYACQLNCPCIYNSNIFIPVDGKIRGYSYKKSAFKDFECSVVSEESKLIKEKNRFVIVNLENVYYLES